MGEVYRAQNVSLGRNVAIKILSEEFSKNEDDVLRFLREARAAAAVRHVNVVDVLDVARDDDGTPFIVQELLAGQDLEQHLQARGGRLSPLEVLEVMIPVAEAVGAAHQRGLVHRDLKPANIFLAREGAKIVPKVLDFGAALYKTVGSLSAKEQRMLIGTPHYMAPEQITTKLDVDARADVWALGIIIYELLVGETPFEAETADAVLKLVKTRAVSPLRAVMKNPPDKIEKLVARCTQPEKSKRLFDANAVCEELVEIRASMKSAARSRPETLAEADDEPPPSSSRVPSLVLSEPKLPTKRRGSAVFTLNTPDSNPPQSSPQKGEDAPPPRSVERPIIDAAALALDDPFTTSPPPRDFKRDPAAQNLIELTDEGGGSLQLALGLESQVSIGSSRPPPVQAKRASSAPPAYDPRSRLPQPVTPISIPPSSGPRGSRKPIPTPSPTPPPVAAAAASLPPSLAPARPRPSARENDEVPLGVKGVLTIAALVVGPALALFGAFHFLGFLTAPIAHAMRGDSAMSSGIFAVITLVCAAVLGVQSFSTGSRGASVSAIGSVLLGIVMIVVTFGANEAAETGSAPVAAFVVPFLAPLVPLGLLASSVNRARELWVFKWERGDAIKSAVIAGIYLFIALELGPIGIIRHL
jgi:serine/threonine-protein kinase